MFFAVESTPFSSPGQVLRRTWLLLLVVLALGTIPLPVRAALERNAPADAEAVFHSIAAAWSDGEEEVLAGLVHRDGLRVTSHNYQRVTSYSPSQAYYYFRNQFQQHATQSFEFQRLQNSGARLDSYESMERVHGMVVWEFRLPGRDTIDEQKLVLVLARQGETWRLVEINTLTAR